jgi:TetR/AcrR family transcriptional repressor of lmrAB and yxaGH operons
VATTAQLLRTQGYNGTGLNQIIEESNAPKGSLYHYFPGGKEELAVVAIRQAASQMGARVHEALRTSRNTLEGLTKFAREMIEDLKSSSFCSACPISTVALESSNSESELQQACADAFKGLTKLIAQGLERDGYPHEQASDLANLAVATYQGGLLLARTERNTRPLERAVRTLGKLMPPPPG